MINPEIYTKLKTCVEFEGNQTERECAEWLVKAAEVLLPWGEDTITFVDAEQISSAGYVDIIVIAESKTASGSTIKKAYVWELKAPQIFLFEKETKNRVRPTKDLYSAENQLLNYQNTISKDGAFLAKWGILRAEHIEFGGIIIGRETTFIDRKDMELIEAKGLADTAQEIREQIFYKAKNIKLWTWDKVLNSIQSRIKYISASNQDKVRTGPIITPTTDLSTITMVTSGSYQ